VHGKPWSSYHTIPQVPDVVVRPCSTEEVARCLRLCYAYRVPVVPYGGATSLEGHTLAPARGVSLDLNRMDRVLRVSSEDMDATVQAGLGYLDLNEQLAGEGICFPLDPGPGASIGGMCACRCSGSTAVKYGTMRDNVLGVTAVLADGTVIRTGTRARKSAAGYDLTRLLIGSEGTLGVITEVTLRLRRKPAHAAAVRVCFPTIRAAAACANATLQAGVEVGRCELMDDDMVRIVNAANGFADPEATTLLYELVGASEMEVQAQVDRVKAVAGAHGGYGVRVSEGEEDATRMWRARKEALWSAGAAYPDRECMITDVCVPLSKLADLIGQTKDEICRSALPVPIVAHAGDGNFHAFVMFHPDKVCVRVCVRVLWVLGCCCCCCCCCCVDLGWAWVGGWLMCMHVVAVLML
jgi:D-lactate dehydrogenase (cytochrome)